MSLIGGEQVTESTSYLIEFYRAEEVAERGEHAEKKIMGLPSSFSMDNKDMMDELLQKCEEIMKEHSFDSMVIKKETYEEYVYYQDIEKK